MEKEKVVLILSGGMDSTTLLYKLVADRYSVHALSFNYGQRHSKELECAKVTAGLVAASHKIVNFGDDMKSLIATSSTLTGQGDIPEGHYANDNMRLTVVPNRNAVMLMLAGSYAISIGAKKLAYAPHMGDHDCYPDCRKAFIDAVKQVLLLCDFEPLELLTPFEALDKGKIAVIGKQLGVPYEHTWTCYKGEEKACGTCGSCGERLFGFDYAGFPDPLEYQDRGSYKTFEKETK